MSLPVKFSPTIELGHLFQALVAAATLTGWALWGYANIEAQIANLHSEIALQQQRVDQVDKTLNDERADQRARDTRIAAGLDKVYDQLSELKAQIAGKADAPRR